MVQLQCSKSMKGIRYPQTQSEVNSKIGLDQYMSTYSDPINPKNFYQPSI